MNDPNETPNDPEIIVDSDWKEQVAQEKEKLKAQSQEETPEKVSEESSEEVSPPSEPEESKSEASLPPASFEVLVSMLFTQALSALGQMPSPSGEPTSIDKSMAKHTIDTLEMLQEKTKGNLSDEESKMVGEALHVLRMTYVSVRG